METMKITDTVNGQGRYIIKLTRVCGRCGGQGDVNHIWRNVALPIQGECFECGGSGLSKERKVYQSQPTRPNWTDCLNAVDSYKNEQKERVNSILYTRKSRVLAAERRAQSEKRFSDWKETLVENPVGDWFVEKITDKTIILKNAAGQRYMVWKNKITVYYAVYINCEPRGRDQDAPVIKKQITGFIHGETSVSIGDKLTVTSVNKTGRLYGYKAGFRFSVYSTKLKKFV
jgi:hypothetical protein